MNPQQEHTILVYDKSANQYSSTIAELSNYNSTYDVLLTLLSNNQTILELACGPANISQYLLKQKNLQVTGFDLSEKMLKLAQNKIPSGIFEKRSIIDFTVSEKRDCVIIGFGLPYLDKEQVQKCLENSSNALKQNGLIYLSFMEGDKCGFEIPSFSKKDQIYLYYHKKDLIFHILNRSGFEILRNWDLDYKESDGTITTDVVLIGRKM